MGVCVWVGVSVCVRVCVCLCECVREVLDQRRYNMYTNQRTYQSRHSNGIFFLQGYEKEGEEALECLDWCACHTYCIADQMG